MKRLAALLAFAAALGVLCCEAAPPQIPCTFSTDIAATVVTRSGETSFTQYSHYSVENVRFAQVGVVADTYPRNMTAIFERPAHFTILLPFFERQTCTILPFESPVPCFAIADEATQAPGTHPCLTDPSAACDVWSYMAEETWYIKAGTAIPDAVIIVDNVLGIKSTALFTRFIAAEPDPSFFVVPASQPCVDLSASSSSSSAESVEAAPPRLLRNNLIGFPTFVRAAGQRQIPGAAQTSRPAATWVGDIPESFDAIAAWPECNISAGMPHQSLDCGAGWAIASAAALGNRICIANGANASSRLVLSPQWMLSCFKKYNFGCKVGFVDLAAVESAENGVATEACMPFQSDDDIPCPTLCADGSPPIVYKPSGYYSIFTAFDLAATEAAVQRDILANGPVATAFWYFYDLSGYKGGIYEHNPQSGALWQHVMRIVGWGVLDGQPVWKIANSFGPHWGDNGFLYVRRGTNECGMMDSIVAFRP